MALEIPLIKSNLVQKSVAFLWQSSYMESIEQSFENYKFLLK